jgi:hypothetical protein
MGLVAQNKAMLLKLQDYLLEGNYQAINGMIDTLIIVEPHVSLMFSVKVMLSGNENDIIRDKLDKLDKLCSVE